MLITGYPAMGQTSKGYNPWWVCPDCGARYRTEDYRLHRATVHEDKYTPETRRQLLGIPEPSPQAPAVYVNVEQTVMPIQEESIVTYTPPPETTPEKTVVSVTGRKLSDRIPALETSLSKVKTILADYGQTVEDVTPDEIRAYKGSDTNGAVSIQLTQTSIMYTKMYSCPKEVGEFKLLQLANQIAEQSGDVRCRKIVSINGVSGLLLDYSVPIRDGVAGAEIIEGFNKLQIGKMVVKAMDKGNVLTPISGVGCSGWAK